MRTASGLVYCCLIFFFGQKSISCGAGELTDLVLALHPSSKHELPTFLKPWSQPEAQRGGGWSSVLASLVLSSLSLCPGRIRMSCSPSKQLIVLVHLLKVDRDFWLCVLAWAIRKIQLLGQPLSYRAGYQVFCHVGAFAGGEWNLSSPHRWFHLHSSFKRLQGQYKQISEQNFKWDFKQVAEHRMRRGNEMGEEERRASSSMEYIWLEKRQYSWSCFHSYFFCLRLPLPSPLLTNLMIVG